jgi:hypothetical protein
MSNAAVATWTKAIHEVQKILDTPSTAPSTKQAHTGLQCKLGLMDADGSLLPSAAWKKLVQDVQVMAYIPTSGMTCARTDIAPTLLGLLQLTD